MIVSKPIFIRSFGTGMARGVSVASGVFPPFRHVLPSSRHRFPRPESSNAFEDGPEEPLGHGDRGHLAEHVPRMRYGLRIDRDELLPQRKAASVTRS